MLIAQNIEKTIESKYIVKNISITISPGEIVGLMGPNGAGKTTFFYMIAGFVLPDSGAITLDDNDITNAPVYQRARKGLGYLPQESSSFNKLTVAQNILMALEIYITNKDQRYKRLQELLDEFHIGHLYNSNASVLSGGERRRLEIARCLAINPKYILLDEPFAGVDPIAIADIIQLIQHLKHQNKVGILITDHNVSEALSIIDRGYIMYEGKIIAEGGAKDILSNSNARKLYLGEKNFMNFMQ